MREIEKRPAQAGAAGTLGIWLLFVLLGFLLPLFPKKEYKTIQIRLDAPQAVQKTKQQAEPQSAPAPAVESAVASKQPVTPPPSPAEAAPQAPVPQQAAASPAQPAKQAAPATLATQAPAKPAAKAVSKPAPAATSKTAPVSQSAPAEAKPDSVKTESLPAPQPAQQTLVQDPMEAFKQQTAKKPKKEFNWDTGFGDDAPATSSSSAPATPNAVAKVDALQGSAATTASTSGGSGSASASAKNDRKEAADASSETSSALKNIASQKSYTVPATNGLSSQVQATTTASSDGKTSLQMTDGSRRKLIRPETPDLPLSEKASVDLVNYPDKIEVSITITVDKDGHVVSVKIPNTVPQTVRREVEQRIRTWEFSSGEGTATATFIHIIKKR